MIRKLATVTILTVLILISPFNFIDAEDLATPSSGQQSITISNQSVNPNDGLNYLFKRVREKIGLLFAFTDKNKIKIYKNLVNVRLAELKYIVENKNMAYFEQATNRYFTTAGQLTEYVNFKKTDDEYGLVKEELERHIPVLTKLRDNYEFGTAEWRFIEDDINYIKGYIKSLPVK